MAPGGRALRNSVPLSSGSRRGALDPLENIEKHLVISRGTTLAIKQVMGIDRRQLKAVADVVHDVAELDTFVCSGSDKTSGKMVMSCSIWTLADIAMGNCSDPINRVADERLKERRRLVFVTRETPLRLIHLRNKESVAFARATASPPTPPTPACYLAPRIIEDPLNQTMGKALDQFDIEHDLFRRGE